MITDFDLHRKLDKRVTKILHDIDDIGPTPARQISECGVWLTGRALMYFDQDRYESDEGYAEAWHKLCKETNQITSILRDRMIEISEGKYDQVK